uniref:Uncharacterized protein n=1 Tax=Rangifer tarandus platyrhynchus TaxID=3082113 RepID=A0ACB0EDK3_RANTA|nr:unnamed protein product [Rangifer tarandus platyrhynchus]
MKCLCLWEREGSVIHISAASLCLESSSGKRQTSSLHTSRDANPDLGFLPLSTAPPSVLLDQDPVRLRGLQEGVSRSSGANVSTHSTRTWPQCLQAVGPGSSSPGDNTEILGSMGTAASTCRPSCSLWSWSLALLCTPAHATRSCGASANHSHLLVTRKTAEHGLEDDWLEEPQHPQHPLPPAWTLRSQGLPRDLTLLEAPQ